MDLLDFAGEQMYFDQPVVGEVAELIDRAAESYGALAAEQSLMRAYFLAPGHLTVLVALYRYFFYRHRWRQGPVLVRLMPVPASTIRSAAQARRPPMTVEDLELDLSELSSAEDFLQYFRVDYDPDAVQVNRLHILQRFHDYLEQAGALLDDADLRWAGYADRLGRAYRDFVASDARTERVFRVFRRQEPHSVTVPLSGLMRGRGAS